MERAQEVAFGLLHMDPESFWDLEPQELVFAIRGYTRREEETLQGEWERTRWLATTLVNIQVKKAVKANDLLPLPWDKKNHKDTEAPTPEQIAAMKAKFNLK